MAKKVQHKSPKLPDEGGVQGCWWGIFHSFDILPNLHFRRLFGQRRSSKRRHTTGIKVQKAKMYLPPAGGEDYVTEAEKNVTVEDRSDSAKEDSNNAQLRAVIGQKISKQKGMAKQKRQKQKVSPCSPRILRTISIHHMECDDYVRPGEMPDDSKVQEASLLSHNSGSSSSNEHMSLSPTTASEVSQGKICEVCGMLGGAGKHLGRNRLDVLGYRLVENQALLQEKIREAKNKLLEHQSVDGKGVPRVVARDHSKDFLETLDLFNANSELLLKILHEQSATTTNYLQGQEGSMAGRVLGKSGSFPGAGFSGRTTSPFELKCRRDETAPLKKRERKSDTENSQALSTSDSTEADKSQVIIDDLEPVSNIHGVCEIVSNSEWSSSFTPVMKSQKDNGTAVYRFKDIKQRIKDIIKENKKEKQRISMDGVLHKIPYGCKVSQEKPSPWEVPVAGRSDSDGSRNSFGSGGACPAYRNPKGHIRRSHSLNESLDRYSYLLESNCSREPKRQISERLKLVPEDGGLKVTNSPKIFTRMLSLPEFDSYFLGKDDQSESSRNLIHSSSISVDRIHENTAIPITGAEEQMSNIFGSSLEHIKENNASPTNGDPDRSMFGNVFYAASDDLETKESATSFLNEQEITCHVESSDKPAKPSPVSVLDSYLPEDLVSPAGFSVLPASTELKPRQAHLEELEPFDSPQNQYDINDSGMAKTDASDNNELQNPGMQPDFDTLCVPVDNMHEFHFVRDMLKKYWFDGDEHFARWNSSCHQLHSSIPEEAEGLIYELESSSRDSDINFDRELLLDLTNEVLLKIYETSYGHCPWLSHSCSCIRPIPVRYHVLEEVWANISWHLKSQPQSNPTLESIISQDFKKNDQWMNLHYDIEDMELDLEVLIFDDLLDEAIIECLDLVRQP